jgi:hypothetical protein
MKNKALIIAKKMQNLGILWDDFLDNYLLQTLCVFASISSILWVIVLLMLLCRI